jgi:peptidoglycan/LPS O-acetylase OafA/YrhL
MADSIERHRNNFGILRLAFAACVLVSHSIELLDGNRAREPLTRIFGTLSLGELGVDGFFLASGYLIAQSLERSASFISYIRKRVLRIYPAFIAAYVFCIFIVAPLANADMRSLSGTAWLRQIYMMLMLADPRMPNTFSDLPYPLLNGSMWTIPYEFRCYVLLALLALVGAFRKKFIFGAFVLALLLTAAFSSFRIDVPQSVAHVTGHPHDTLRLTAIFLSGATFYVFRDKIPYRTDLAMLSGILLVVLLFNRATEELAMPTLGAYLIFWFAFLERARALNRINNGTDISYGVYLYAWPIQNLLIDNIPGASPFSIIALTTTAVVPIGFLSWHAIEKPSLSLKGPRERKVSQDTPPLTDSMSCITVHASPLPRDKDDLRC